MKFEQKYIVTLNALLENCHLERKRLRYVLDSLG